MSNATAKLQLNYKLPDGTLINVYVAEPLELPTLLGILRDSTQEIAETGQLLAAGGTVAAVMAAPVQQPAPQAPPAWVPDQQAQAAQWQQPAQPAPAPAPQQQSTSPSCPHGPQVYKAGVGRESGKPYKGWFCGANVQGCKPTFIY